MGSIARGGKAGILALTYPIPMYMEEPLGSLPSLGTGSGSPISLAHGGRSLAVLDVSVVAGV